MDELYLKSMIEKLSKKEILIKRTRLNLKEIHMKKSVLMHP